MNLNRATAALVFTMSVLSADRAFAQTAFVQGGFGIDSRRFSGQPEDRVFDGNVAAVMIGGGGFLTPLMSASVELDLGAELETEQRVTVTIAGRPGVVTTTYVSRRRSVSALFGIHSPAHRTVRVGAYAGLAFTAFQQRISADAPAIVLRYSSRRRPSLRIWRPHRSSASTWSRRSRDISQWAPWCARRASG